ncbi:Necrosis inducing protein NPP1 type [Phytophthora nicotianae]|nr:Necrosis inducing protein NPP1 type [Phytophthora nicotianae]
MQTSSLTTARVARAALRRASSELDRRIHMQRGALSLLTRSKSSLAPEAAVAEAAADSELADEFENMAPRRLAEADWAIRAQKLIPRATVEKPYELAPLTLGLEELIGKTEEELANPAELAKSSRSFMSDEDVDKWLEGFEIPNDQLARCSTAEEVQEMRRRYARQLRLECSVYEMAMDKYSASHDKVRQLGRSTSTNAAKDLIRKWIPETEKYIEAEQKKIKAGKHSTDSNIYGPALMLLRHDVLAAIGMNIMLNMCLMESKGPKFIKLALAMGKAVQEEIISKKEATTKRHEDKEDQFYLQVSKNIKLESLKMRMKEYVDTVGGWDKRLQLKVGAAVVDCIQRTCYVPNEFGEVSTPELCAAKGLPPPEPAFIHNYVFDRNRRAGVIQIHQKMADTVLATSPDANVLPWTARYLPMLVPPRPWTGVVNGGYLKLRTKIMRQRDSAWQMDCVQRGDMDGILKALNLMAEVPWVINKEVLDVVLQIWEDGGNFGDLPTRTDVPLPDPDSPEFASDPALYHKNVRKIEQLNREFHSLRYDELYSSFSNSLGIPYISEHLTSATMLRVVPRFNQTARRVATTATKSFVGVHSAQCRCGNCAQHAMGCTCPRCQSRSFSVNSQTKYTIPKTQTAVVFDKTNGPLTVRKDWPVTQQKDLKPGEVLVRLAYSGVCHSDLHIWKGDFPLEPKLPCVGGHEGAGYVAAIGDHTRSNLKVGDPVGVKWIANSCLGCEDCRKGHEHTCPAVDQHGFTVDGSFQQWCVSFADHVTPIPSDLNMAAAAPILCAGVTVYKAMKEIGGVCGDSVVIPGAGGGLGHYACQYARAMGYRVIAIDTGADKRKLIESYGIKDFIDFKDGNVREKVLAATDGRGAHATVVVASNPEAYNDALSFLRPHGAVVMVGLPKDAKVTADVFGSVLNAHRIIGSYVGNRQDSIEALKVAAGGDVSTNYSIEKLDNLPSVFERMEAGKLAGRVVLDCA